MPNERLRLHLAGQNIDRYRLIKRISAGGMAEVYLATLCPDEHESASDFIGTDSAGTSPHAMVAIKVVCPTNDVILESGITDIEEHFISEGALLMSLQHPFILPVYETGSDRGYLYHVMEYVPTGSLADAICGRSKYSLELPLSLPEALEIICQVGSALEYIHERDIVHRDVKPGNLLLRIDELNHRQLLLSDFGVARWEVNASRHEDQVTGTVAYMAPEVFSGWFSAASDQYSLAVMAFQLLTGHLPFEGTMEEQIAGHLQLIAPSIRMYVEDLPWEVEEVISRALEKRAVDRYPSVAVFVDGLLAASREADPGEEDDTLAAPEPVTLPAYRPPLVPQLAHHRTPSHGKRALLPLVTAGLLLLALSITLFSLPGRGPSDTGAEYQRLPAGAQIGDSPSVAVSPSSVATHVPTIPVPTTTVPPPAQPIDSALLVALSKPASVRVGHLFTFRITLANTGTSTWLQTEGYQLTCDLQRHPAQNCPSGFVATLGKYAVAPGRDVTFEVWLSALTNPGIYTAWINMAHSRAPFKSRDIFVQIETLAATATPGPDNPATATPGTPAHQPTVTPSPLPEPTVTPSPPPPEPTVTPSPTAVPTATAGSLPSP
jgi:serine/threonine protein kinase